MIVWAFSRLVFEDRLRKCGGSGGVDIFIGCRIIAAIVVITPRGKVQMEAIRIHSHCLRKRSGENISSSDIQIAVSALGSASIPVDEAHMKPPSHTKRAGSQYVRVLRIANETEKGEREDLRR